MKNTFKQAYKRTQQADGTVLIRCKSNRVGTYSVGAVTGIAAIPIVFVSLLAAGFIAVFTHKEISSVTVLVITGILFFALDRALTRNTNLTIHPKSGLAWGHHQLPFSDISAIGISSDAGDAGRVSYVYAQTGGRMVKLTGYMPKARAEAIQDDIKQLSGAAWR